MRVLIDTNILIDYLIEREPFYEKSKEVLLKCFKGEIDGYVAAHSIMNIYYITRRHLSLEERHRVLIDLCQAINVVGVDKNKIIKSLKNADFKDMEDCLQTECAVECGAEYIITRNIKDFATSKVTPILPEKFLSEKI